MNEEMKLNAVKNLIQSLDFSRAEKEALVRMLQQELGAKAETEQSVPQEYGPKLPMSVMFEDGTIGQYRDRVKKIVGIVINGLGRRFALYAVSHGCPNKTPLPDANRYADSLPKIQGKNWRVLTEGDCRIMVNRFRSINSMLETLGCRTIVESNRIGILTSDGSMAGHYDWQVWFAMDI